MNGLIKQVATYHGAILEFTELLRVTISLQMFVEADCMPLCLILYTCGDGCD